MLISKSTTEDINDIFKLYNIASDYQRSKKEVVVWPEFSRTLVATEIADGRQFKLLIENTVACIWAITYSDPQIWEARNADPAIYIHRIATNPELRGNNYVKSIVNWAKPFAKAHNKRFIRLDTLGNNERLIAHYKNCGFDFLGMFPLKNTSDLPSHYALAPACLFEIDLEN